ncbi:MAG: hypothetical protein P4L50_30125 [Anaerolineaceae bacterium]|nr:hypothetical protein [Anaerolineaceae bacterium]
MQNLMGTGPEHIGGSQTKKAVGAVEDMLGKQESGGADTSALPEMAKTELQKLERFFSIKANICAFIFFSFFAIMPDRK